MKHKVVSVLISLFCFLVSFGYLVIGVVNYNGLSMKTVSFLHFYFYNFLISDQFTVDYICSLIIMVMSAIWVLILSKKVG